ncbi:hypothetical protein [Lentzea sp. NPDC003310]|uniref:hypothetical protein n=1 Tax=Lentzea sp. NPDC003310 TaxID=3154447 RepID=UPI0033B80862
MTRGIGHPAVHFLLSLAEPEDAVLLRRRLGVGEPEQHAVEHAVKWVAGFGAPRSVLLWMLEEDDPAINAAVFDHEDTPDAVRRDILRGRPFGAAGQRLEVLVRADEPEIPVGAAGVVGELRAAAKLKRARAAARAVGRDDWDLVAEADGEEPLPGYARWALSERFDCPPALRAQFGSHAKFDRRLWEAGVVEPAEYAERGRRARQVLGVLHFARVLFPRRAQEAAAVLAPLVRFEVGVDPDAWAVLVRRLQTFAGTVPELLRTSGAIARG